MKTLTTLITCLWLATFSAFGQTDLEISVKEKSNDPNSKKERYHLIEVRNNTNSSQTIEITSQNVNCENVDSSKNAALSADFVEKNKLSAVNTISLSPRESKEFYVKIYRPNNTRLNTWNCTEIIAKSVSDNTRSNALIITSFIPDPNDFN